MSVDGGSSNESCFQNCIDSTTKPPAPPKSRHQQLLNQYAPVKSSQQISLSSKRSKNKQVVLSKRKFIGKGAYAVSDTESDSPPPPLSAPRHHTKSVTNSYRSSSTHSKASSSPREEEPGQPKPEVDEYELRVAIENTLKSMQIVPDHVLQLTVNETFQNMKMNQQQKQHNFPPIVKTTIEKHMPPDEIRKFYQQDDLVSDQQFTKIKGYLLNTTALATTAFASMHITGVGTKYLHESMREFVTNPQNRSTFDECGQYIRGTIFDSPVFSIGSSIVGVFRDSHDREMSERRNMTQIEEEEETEETDDHSTPIATMEANIKEFKQRNTIIDVMPPSLLKKKNHNSVNPNTLPESIPESIPESLPDPLPESIPETLPESIPGEPRVITFESFMPTMEFTLPNLNLSQFTLPVYETYKNDLANRIYEKKNSRLQKSFHQIK